MDWEEKRQTKLDHYLAQIAAEVRRSLVKHPNKVKVKDFYVTYTEAEKQDRIAKSKQAWGAAVNIKIDRN